MARGRRLGGLTTTEFWSLTPGEVDGIIKDAIQEKMEFEKLADARNAALLALTYNCHRSIKDKALSPADFLPRKREELDDDELEEKIKFAFRQFPKNEHSQN